MLSNLKKKYLVTALLILVVIVGVALLVKQNTSDSWNVDGNVAGGKPIDNQVLIEKLDKQSDESIKYVYELSPDNIVVGSIYKGDFTGSGKQELLVIFKLLNTPHAGGLDCSVAAVYDQSTFELISQKTFPSDECNFRILTDNKNRGYLLFSGSSTYQGYTSYKLELWKMGKELELLYPDNLANADDRKYEIRDEETIAVAYSIMSNKEGSTLFEWVPEYNLVWNKETCIFDKVIPNEGVSSILEIREKHELADGSSLLFKTDENHIERMIGIDSEKGKKVICDKKPSSPVVSPDGNKFAYMDVLEWEVPGEVYLYDLEKGKSELIIKQNQDIKDQHTPKGLCWLDNNRLLAIIGFAYGTVSVGGELYLYDVEQGKLSLVLEPGEQEEICAVTVSEDEVAIEYAKFDEEWNHSTRETKTYKLQEFLSLIK
jgi:hypothetical protein